MTAKISAYVIAFNEVEKIQQALQSLAWADEIVLVDSHSADGTTEIAESMGAKVIHVAFEGYGHLRNQAIKACSYEWVFSLDADERCTPEVASEIQSIVNSENARDVYFVPRRNFFMGRWIKHSGWYPNYRQPQLFRKGSMEYDLLPVHEGYVLKTNKSPGYLQNAIWQAPFKDSGELIRKADKYASLGALKLQNKRVSVFAAALHALWSFLKHYIFKLGVLDGGPGFVIALSNAFGTFYKYLKIIDLQSGDSWRSPPGV